MHAYFAHHGGDKQMVVHCAPALKSQATPRHALTLDVATFLCNRLKEDVEPQNLNDGMPG